MANNFSRLTGLSHRELYAAYHRAKRNGLFELSIYIKAMADLKYAKVKNDHNTELFVKENAEIMNKYRQMALSQATPENIQLVLTSTSGKKA